MLRPGLPPLPRRIARLPIDERGYPIPWFVSEVDGKRDFRLADGAKRVKAVRESICWVCGGYLGVHKTFAIGPMCAINRVTSEPPCHTDCAVFSAIACPFLSKPPSKRRTTGLPEDMPESPGVMLDRNPGATCLWTTGTFAPFHVPNGWLIRLGQPTQVEWYAKGRKATRAEVVESVESGMPVLMELAEKDGPEAVEALLKAKRIAVEFYPVATSQ